MFFGPDHYCWRGSFSQQRFSTTKQEKPLNTHVGGFVYDFEEALLTQFVHRWAMTIGSVTKSTVEVAGEGRV